jgi:(p)ppGpp synthase/HD superfamily hydrolase
MEGRLTRTLEDAGLAVADVAVIAAAHRLAMEPRRERLGDPHHPDFLHPGRTALILAVDASVRDPLALASGTLVESERSELRVPLSRIRAELGDALADHVGAVPLPGATDGLAEALVAAPLAVCLVALAERLDHCRHAKFWRSRADRERILAEAVGVYGPIAERTDEALARRFAHWSEAFARTLSRGPG